MTEHPKLPHSFKCRQNVLVSPYLVESTPHCLVQAVRNVGSAQNQDTGCRGGHPLHLHQELGLDAPRRLALTLSSGTTQGINLHMHSRPSHNRQAGPLTTASAFTGLCLKSCMQSSRRNSSYKGGAARCPAQVACAPFTMTTLQVNSSLSGDTVVSGWLA